MASLLHHHAHYGPHDVVLDILPQQFAEVTVARLLGLEHFTLDAEGCEDGITITILRQEDKQRCEGFGMVD